MCVHADGNITALKGPVGSMKPSLREATGNECQVSATDATAQAPAEEASTVHPGGEARCL